MKGFLITLILIIAFLFLGFTDVGNNLISSDLTTSVETKDTRLEKDEGIISRVIDGDTILVINSEGKEERVRLLLIDTPESFHPDEPVQKFGKESSEFAKQYLKTGQKVIIEKGNPEKDKYNRTLAYIFIDDVNFNKLMVEKGYARIAYVYNPNAKYLVEFKQAEDVAKQKNLKIWSIPGYVTDDGFDMSVVQD